MAARFPSRGRVGRASELPTLFLPLPDGGFPIPAGSAPTSGESVMDRFRSVCPSRLSALRAVARVVQERSAGQAGPPRAGEFRTELVERLRSQIAAGTYDPPERWEAALDRLAELLLPS